MKPMRFIIPVLTGAMLILYFSCQKTVSPGSGFKPVEYVTASVSGRVTDGDNIPVQGASVKAGAAATITDINGNFTLNGVSLDKNAGYIKVEKEGFFQGSRTIMVSTASTNRVTIQLIKKTTAGIVSGTTGGTVTVPTGGSIVFQGASFVNDATKAAYTGQVNVSAFYINPTASNLGAIMPGALRGIDEGNEERALQSFGMMAVELNGASGEKLQLAASKTASLTFPIPAKLLAQAPATIPLWSFNDSSGLWKQEGIATRSGNKYIGTVAHFSYWNCDAPYPLINFSVTVKDQSGNPLTGAQVTIMADMGQTDTASAISSYGFTDDNGVAQGKVPANKPLTMIIYNRCGATLLTQKAGPFSSDKDLGTVTVANTGATSVTISGTAVTCANLPVTNGIVNVLVEGSNYRSTFNNGSFSITLARCSNEAVNATISVIDVTNNVQGTKDIAVTQGAINAGEVSACGTQLDEFVNYALNGTDYNFTSPVDSVASYSYNNTITVNATVKTSNQRSIDLSFNATGTGTVPLNWVYFQQNNSGFTLNSPASVNITEFGASGTGYVAGNFTATLVDSLNTSTVIPASCTFRVKRN